MVPIETPELSWENNVSPGAAGPVPGRSPRTCLLRSSLGKAGLGLPIPLSLRGILLLNTGFLLCGVSTG